MARYFRVGSRLMVLQVLLISMMIMASGAIADTGVKNNGIVPEGRATPSDKNNGIRGTVGRAYPAGTKVKAVVDHPSESDCIRINYTGTILCYDPDDPILPYLVEWDHDCPFVNCAICGICSTNGWWVGFDEVVETDPVDVIPVGSKVRAIVDHPSESDCIRINYTGTLVCYDPDDPVLPYLVEWDHDCPFVNCAICGICTTNGWWVGFDEITAGGNPPKTISGCAELNGQPLANRPVTLQQTGGATKTTRTNSSGCYEFTNPAVGKKFKVIIRGPRVRP